MGAKVIKYFGIELFKGELTLPADSHVPSATAGTYSVSAPSRQWSLPPQGAQPWEFSHHWPEIFGCNRKTLSRTKFTIVNFKSSQLVTHRESSLKG